MSETDKQDADRTEAPAEAEAKPEEVEKAAEPGGAEGTAEPGKAEETAEPGKAEETAEPDEASPWAGKPAEDEADAGQASEERDYQIEAAELSDRLLRALAEGEISGGGASASAKRRPSSRSPGSPATCCRSPTICAARSRPCPRTAATTRRWARWSAV